MEENHVFTFLKYHYFIVASNSNRGNLIDINYFGPFHVRFKIGDQIQNQRKKRKRMTFLHFLNITILF